VSLRWPELVALALILAVLVVMGLLLIVREPRSRRLRFGIFIEREDRETHRDKAEKARPDE